MKRAFVSRLLPLVLVGGVAAAIPTVATGTAAASGSQVVRHLVFDGTRALPASHMGTPKGVQSHETPPSALVKALPGSRSTHSRVARIGPAIPSVAPTAITNPGFTSASFNGLNGFQQRYANGGNQFSVEPPDQGLCAGNGFVLETVNDVLRAFDTTGHAMMGVLDLNTFFGYAAQFNRSTGAQGPFVTDPSCLYDNATGKWFVTVLTLEVDPSTGALLGPNHLDTAVSKTGDPTGSWSFYHIAVQDDGTGGTPTHTDCPCIGDYPHIGADKFGYFITTNEYPLSSAPGLYGNNFNGAQIYAISKSQLASGAASPTTVQIESPTLGASTPSFTVWPANVPGVAFDTKGHGTEWFLQSTAAEEALGTGDSTKLGVWRINGTSTLNTASPALVVKNKVLKSEEYALPPRSEQKVGPVPLRDCLVSTCPILGAYSPEVEGPLDSNDTRMQQTYLAGGLLYGSLDTLVDVNGRYQAGVAYFVVKADDTFSGVAISNQGYVAVNGNITYPAIAVKADGKGVMAMTLVGADWNPSAAYINIGPTGVTGTVQVAKSGLGPEDGFCEYNLFDCAGTGSPPTARPRWGDYGAAVVDGTNLWFASEYIAQKCTIDTYLSDPTCGGTRGVIINWGTRISQLAG